MKRKIAVTLLLAFIMAFSATIPAFATTGRQGQIGFFGGITEGIPLPMTTEAMILDANTGRTQNVSHTDLVYTEILWLDGTPVEFTGLMDVTVRNGGGRSANANFGTRIVTFNIRPNENIGDPDVLLVREITFNVNWRRVGDQIIETYSAANWVEEVYIYGMFFELDRERSHYEISIIRDITPGVTYYSGIISARSVFWQDDAEEAWEVVTHEVVGQIYGFETAWSAVETQRITGIVDIAGGMQIQYEIVPSVAVSKELQYRANEPTLISFAGNYREVTTSQSGLNFVINVMPTFMANQVTPQGRATLDSFNRFEQLIAPNLNSIRGHWAYQDIRRLFAMEIITGNPEHFIPNQAVTRAEFMTMLARAVKLPIDQAHRTPPVQRGNRPLQVQLIFPDLWPNRPDYAYLRAINEAGIAVGRGDGHFHPDEVIMRQEAYVLALRTLGLGRLSLDMPPVSIFADNGQIADWAMSDIQAATRIGLIAPDEDGNLNPQEYMTKAQAAALINRLIEYMRHELIRDYTENIINFMN
ncbi:MAG: S-layer homology domain-containing protein [Defluviitaleaceae bacterium]|nr:S-layer homology domain-containing protein [Defluviitaleaceae bacterium]